MNFQGLVKIETVDFYIDVAIKRSKKKGDDARGSYESKLSRLQKSKIIEIEKINTLSNTLTTFLDKIIRAYPDLEALPEFYKQLLSLTLEMERLKKSLGGLNWVKSKLVSLTNDYITKIKKTSDLQFINKARREHLGRATSLIKQIKNELRYLEEARVAMKKYPAIKTGIKTIAIAGFPNVGKSTLLSKLTTSKPEINNYAFTTKTLMMGYLKKDYHELQMIDTPGTLNRVEKMNSVEIQAYLAMRYVADNIIFIFDLTESYPISEQIKLYKNVLKFHKPTFAYLSKTDILEKEKVEAFIKENEKIKFLTFDDIKEMKGLL